jgi:hypothetical protein
VDQALPPFVPPCQTVEEEGIASEVSTVPGVRESLVPIFSPLMAGDGGGPLAHPRIAWTLAPLPEPPRATRRGPVGPPLRPQVSTGRGPHASRLPGQAEVKEAILGFLKTRGSLGADGKAIADNLGFRPGAYLAQLARSKKIVSKAGKDGKVFVLR